MMANVILQKSVEPSCILIPLQGGWLVKLYNCLRVTVAASNVFTICVLLGLPVSGTNKFFTPRV